jgi:ACS family allantoate permease-like MFS transporter
MIFGICDVACMCLLFAIRVLLSRENKRRDAEPPNDAYDNVFLTKIDQEGNRVEMKVSKVCRPYILCCCRKLI